MSKIVHNVSLLPHQMRFVQANKKFVLFSGGIGSGKCHGIGTEILMFDGSIKKVEDIVVGDRLMGPDSTPRHVLSLASGREELFKIVDKKSKTGYVVNKSHILSLKQSGSKYGRKTGDIVNMSVDQVLAGPQRWLKLDLKGWRTGVEFASQDVSIDPYTIGLRNKQIPQAYLRTSRENRLQLLAGLIDTDGSYDKKQFEITQKSKVLSEQIQYLARSLGFYVSVTSKMVKCNGKMCGPYYRIGISGNGLEAVPTRLERKQAQPRTQIKDPLVYGIDIQPLGEGDYYGFTLDGDHLYLLGDFSVTHNTHAGSHFVLKMITQYPNARGFIGANSYKQLHNSVLTRLKAELANVGVEYKYNSLTGILNIEGTEVYTGTLENGSYNNHRGIEVGWVWCDEVRDLQEEAWLMLTGRLRDARGPLLMRGTTSPAGFNWLYDHWLGEKKSDNHEIITASSHGNIFLPDGYIEAMTSTYDELFYQQEVLGQFVNLTSGKVYRSYQPEINDRDDYDVRKNKTLLVGMDFNVSPMTAVVAHRTLNGLVVFDEIWLSDANTYQMAEEITKRYGDWGCNIIIYPDHTGSARKTAAVMSDHQILKKAGFTVRSSRNPLKEDRYNAVNGMLDHNRLQITKKCKMLRRDLQQVMYEDNASHLTHVSDALGYLVWREFPVQSRTTQRSYAI